MRYTEEELLVKVGEQAIARLNPYLIARQQIDKSALEQIKASHVLKYHLFKKAKKTKNNETLREMAQTFEQLEFAQQAAWGFPLNANFHRWFDFPACACPKLDNSDRVGTNAGRIISEACPAHGPAPTIENKRKAKP